MVVLKVIVFVLALFLSLLYINNLIADIASVISWSTTIHSEEELKEKDKVTLNYAKSRLIIALLVSIFWGVFIVL